MKNENLLPKTKATLNILWVEDDEILRESIHDILELLGHNFDTASSGKLALKFLNLNTYDYVITDIGMPEMNGWQLADIINEKFENKIKIAVVSGWSTDSIDEGKKEHNIKHSLSKPFTIQQIVQLLEDMKN